MCAPSSAPCSSLWPEGPYGHLAWSWRRETAGRYVPPASCRLRKAAEVIDYQQRTTARCSSATLMTIPPAEVVPLVTAVAISPRVNRHLDTGIRLLMIHVDKSFISIQIWESEQMKRYGSSVPVFFPLEVFFPTPNSFSSLWLWPLCDVTTSRDKKDPQQGSEIDGRKENLRQGSREASTLASSAFQQSQQVGKKRCWAASKESDLYLSSPSSPTSTSALSLRQCCTGG